LKRFQFQDIGPAAYRHALLLKQLCKWQFKISDIMHTVPDSNLLLYLSRSVVVCTPQNTSLL
jgi:hypothetical protein